MLNLYSNTTAEMLFLAGNPGLAKSYAMNEMEFENEIFAAPYDEDEEEKDVDDEDEDEDEDDEDGDEDDEDLDEDELGDDEDIDFDEDEDGDLEDLDDEDADSEEEDRAPATIAARSEAATRPAVAERPVDKEALAAAGLLFNCYICDEPSGEICARCTRDTCDNHICERCMLCSDCCTCDNNPR